MPTKKTAAKPVVKKEVDLSASFDLSDFDTLTPCEDGIDITLKNPITGKDFETPTGPMSVKVIGPESNRYQGAMDKMVKSLSALYPDKSVLQALNEPHTTKSKAIQNEFMATAIIGWDNVYMKNDEDELEPMKFSKRQLIDVIKKCSWIQPQLEPIIKDSINFIKG